MTLHMGSLVQILGQMLGPEPGHSLLFVYDQLLNEDRLRSRVPHPDLFCRARLTNSRCLVNRNGVITLMPRLGYVTHGVIWEIRDDEFRNLDQQFLVPNVTERRGAFAKSRHGQLVPVEFYRALDTTPGRVDVTTHLRMLALAHEWRFPLDYIEEIESWPTLPLNGDF
jgi:hypothetical protein